MVKDSWLKDCLDCIEHVCQGMDFLSDPSIEEKMVCDLGCCVGDSPERDLLEYHLPVIQDHLGDDCLKLLQEYEKRLDEFMCYEKGFSKTQEWLDFVAFINTVNSFLKDILCKHGKKFC